MGNSQSEEEREQEQAYSHNHDVNYHRRRRKPRNRSISDQRQQHHSGYDSMIQYDAQPSNRRQQNVQPSNRRQQNTQPSNRTQQDVQPSNRRQQNTQPSNRTQQNVQPSNRRQQNTQPSNRTQQNVQPSNRRQQNTQPSNRRQQNTQPSNRTQQNVQPSITVATSISFSQGSSQHEVQSKSPEPVSQNMIYHANNYVIPAADSKREDPWKIIPCKGGQQNQALRVCPQYNGQGCVTEPCRRLHVCFYWATKTCTKSYCQCDHSFDSMHNRMFIDACAIKQELKLDDSLGKSFMPERLQICPFSVLRKCSKTDCSRKHFSKNYLWEVKGNDVWIQMSYQQSDYLELMYSHPSEEQVDLIPIQTDIGNNRNLQRLADLLSKETSWSVDFEAFKLNGTSSMHEIRRLSTVSDVTSRLPAATRWVWYWQDDDGCWEPYLEGAQNKCYYVALSDHLEFILRAQNTRFATIHINEHSYCIDGKEMTQTNTTTGRTRRVRRRPAYTLLCKKSIKFDDLFLIQPTAKKYLKLPLVPLSSEFIFVEGLLKQTLAGLKIATIHRIQNDHLWKVYQNKKRFLISLNNGDTTTINEQYLFHGTSHEAVDHICAENFDWRLYGTNVGHLYGQGTYFTNLAKLAYTYGKSNKTGKKVMLVVLVLVGKTTVGQADMSIPPSNACTGRRYDTTCDKETSASIFVKYDRDEYYPAYVVKYSCAS